MLTKKLFLLSSGAAIANSQGTVTIYPKRVFHNSPVTRMHHFLAKNQIGYLATTQAIGLTNVENLAYSGPAFFGTPLQGSSTSDFIYDTGSGWVTVTGDKCTSCSSMYYSSSASSSYAASTLTAKTALYYGSASLYGNLGND